MSTFADTPPADPSLTLASPQVQLVREPHRLRCRAACACLSRFLLLLLYADALRRSTSPDYTDIRFCQVSFRIPSNGVFMLECSGIAFYCGPTFHTNVRETDQPK